MPIKKYGIPYMGSKSKIAEFVLSHLPSTDNLYDLFGGGFSISHAALVIEKPKWKNIIYNEKLPGFCELIRDAIDGKYNYEVFKPEFITREKFHREIGCSAYLKTVWSFGNNQRTYLFGREIEKKKESMHNAVVFDLFDGWFKDNFKFNSWGDIKCIKKRRLHIGTVIRNLSFERYDLQQLEQLERLQQLEQLERLQQLEQLQQPERLQQLELLNMSYDDVPIKDNSIIYCDPPYAGTSKYGKTSFDHEKFFNWANEINQPVFISEYNADDRFYKIAEIEKMVSISATGLGKNKATEKIFINKFAHEKYFKD